MITIPSVETELLIEEKNTDGHSPLKFKCNTGDIYYCKYLVTSKKEELNCLAYEVVAHYLLKELQIPTPEIALIVVSEGTLNNKLIVKNRRLKINDICFGSKDVFPASEVNDMQLILKKKEFNIISNPKDIIKIAAFDLWVNNTDRGRFIDPGFNYNLLLQSDGKKQKILAFDNAFIFGGIDQLGIFNPNIPTLTKDKLIKTTYYKSLIGFISNEEFIEVVDNFIPLLKKDYSKIVNDVIDQVKVVWDLSLDLNHRIIKYLSSLDRIQKVKDDILQSKR
ncbi:HipA family kinase [Pontibacter akesuensis]|uniref:HipA-like kinase domain-containing protein n=1 Tax=Pontibacter akesuensis TaxID=388950 RepID=A0A1I7KSJ8_9BACT|nr:HipA family kinase [Pontibacter akesuensis]GHA80978.1 hypothetical protein GCM10007389_39400 [Pontibacter akesuensis]SFV00324.1 hypothetical protein SAMN04487941_4040 [Pontibacter akesuensis]